MRLRAANSAGSLCSSSSRAGMTRFDRSTATSRRPEKLRTTKRSASINRMTIVMSPQWHGTTLSGEFLSHQVTFLVFKRHSPTLDVPVIDNSRARKRGKSEIIRLCWMEEWYCTGTLLPHPRAFTRSIAVEYSPAFSSISRNTAKSALKEREKKKKKKRDRSARYRNSFRASRWLHFPFTIF